jgi:exo-beta-1,3-glucanase (GH17 family)
VDVPYFDNTKPFGVAYSPYTDSGDCKVLSDIESDMQTIQNAGYDLIRLYGVDCDQVSNVLQALSTIGSNVGLMVGVFNIDSVSADIGTIISAVNGNWNNIMTVTVLNEVVNDGLASPAEVVSLTAGARSQLRA